MPSGGRPAALLLLAALVWVPGGAPACPALCTCYVSPPTVSCQANNFSSVPAGLPPGARRLFLQNNVIGALRAGTFGPSTVTLWLYSNNISSIQPGTFRHLPALEELDLGDNPHLRVLAPDTFHGLHRLQALHLYRCRLASLPSGIFRGLRSLQYLYLQENGLLYLQVGEVGRRAVPAGHRGGAGQGDRVRDKAMQNAGQRREVLSERGDGHRAGPRVTPARQGRGARSRPMLTGQGHRRG